MSTVGIIFTNLHGKNVPELVRLRTMGSVPFAGRYRLVDFVLSNMVNSGVTKVGIITKYNYQSLMYHVGSGKEWDLARKNGGLIMLPPYGAPTNDRLYSTRLEALKGVMGFLNRCKEEYVIMSDCDKVFNIDLDKAIEQHKATNADITLVYRRAVLTREEASQLSIIRTGEDGRVNELLVRPNLAGELDHLVNVVILRRQLLVTLVADAISHGFKSFEMDILAANTSRMRIFGYQYEGYYADLNSLAAYFKCSMDLLNEEVIDALFGQENRPIYTKVKDSPPTKYSANAKVKNSFIADGCYIEGTVENCILFRGVKIGKGAVVKNCILMQDTCIGADAELDCVISDKNVYVKDRRKLAGCETLPFFIAKGSMV